MTAFFYYALKVIGCSGLLYGYYFIALRNKAFHQWNRFYLLATAILSLIFPLIKININAPTAENITPLRLIQVITATGQGSTEFVSQHPGQNFSWALVIEIVYLSMTIIMALVLTRSLKEIIGLIKKNQAQKIEKIKLIYTSIEESPFSFFNYIFWKEGLDMTTDPGKQIFDHEIIHVKENHSLDKLFIELALTFFWFNPIFWFIRKEISIIHEFIADKTSVGSDRKLFALMILETGPFNERRIVSNYFSSSSIKRRWQMINADKKNKIFYFSRIISLFVFSLIFLFASFAFKAKDLASKKNTEILSGIASHDFISTGKDNPGQTNLNQQRLEEPEVVVYNFSDKDKLYVSEINKIDETIPIMVIERKPNAEFVLKIKERRVPVYPELTSPRLIIYPNKLNSEFVIGASPEKNWHMDVDIFDSQNNLVLKEKLNMQLVNKIYTVYKFDFTNLKKGIYLINVISSDNKYRQTYKLVKDY